MQNFKDTNLPSCLSNHTSVMLPTGLAQENLWCILPKLRFSIAVAFILYTISTVQLANIYFRLYSSTLAWKIPWTEEPGGLQPMGSLRVGHDWATSLSLFTLMHWRRKWQPTPVFLPGESQGRGACWAAIYGVAQSRTRLKRLSSSSSSRIIYS